MTREEAINMLKSKMDGHTDTSYEWAETVRMAIKALEAEPCSDAISKQDMLDAIGHGMTYTSEELQAIINKLPSVQPIRPKGRWEHGALVCTEYEGREVVGRKYAYWYCGECKLSIERGEKPNYKYCPNCGADMRESEG